MSAQNSAQENQIEEALQALAKKKGAVLQTGNGANYVQVREVMGAIFLGISNLVLLAALLRAEKRNRHLLARLHEAGSSLETPDRL